MGGENGKIKNEDLEPLLREILKNTKVVRNYVRVQQTFWVLKLVFIVIPLVLAIIYLPPLVKELTAKYSSILNLYQIK